MSSAVSDETDVGRREGKSGGSFLVQLDGHPSKMEEARELSKTGVWEQIICRIVTLAMSGEGEYFYK